MVACYRHTGTTYRSRLPGTSRPGIVRLKRGGTSLREKAGFKGKQANGVGTQLMKKDRSQLAQRYYHVTTTMCTLRLLAPE
jgi:hypothetical protein